ncbi:GlcD FAD/FMN-containing dehydrogenases [Burkholderiaceae bacterium]
MLGLVDGHSMRPLASWGRLSDAPHRVVPLIDPASALRLVAAPGGILPSTGIPYGMGRSYGDACLNSGGTVWATSELNHAISFDRQSGRLVCEAGVLLRDIQQLAVPAGWMLPVTPGTQMATVGGAIANDVHGKNHHVMGTFGDHVLRLKLLRTDGQLIECGPDLELEWFAATLGGIGLTGLVLEAELQLRKVPGPWLETETVPYGNVGEFFALATESETDWEYTVSWIDCLASSGGRGLFMRGNHCETGLRPEPVGRSLTMPVVPPISLVNGLSLRPFNEAYFYLNKRKTGLSVSHYKPFFYPLDNLQHWNRMYGPRGFYQYQSVVPFEVGADATSQMLAEIGRSGQGSFLSVLKTFGSQRSKGMLSFPQPGVTLALDFPNKGASTLALFDRLDAIVREAKGRIYLGKDARMPRDLFEAGYPRLPEFLKYHDPGMSSEMSRRLMGI